jgi:putative endonuclease
MGSADARPARGRAAEDAACRTLVGRGYEILARNVRLAGAELDVVARDGDTIVFIEVRSRSSRRLGAPLETIGPGKQARVARAAAAWLARHGDGAVPARFDVVGVDWEQGRARCTLVRAAFESPF